MTTRRDFLRRLTLGAAGLWLADDALAQLVEPHHKIWPVGIDLCDALPMWEYYNRPGTYCAVPRLRPPLHTLAL